MPAEKYKTDKIYLQLLHTCQVSKYTSTSLTFQTKHDLEVKNKLVSVLWLCVTPAFYCDFYGLWRGNTKQTCATLSSKFSISISNFLLLLHSQSKKCCFQDPGSCKGCEVTKVIIFQEMECKLWNYKGQFCHVVTSFDLKRVALLYILETKKSIAYYLTFLVTNLTQKNKGNFRPM